MNRTIKRYPYKENDLLQAWDAADELILKHCNEINFSQKRVLIINDHFGALSIEIHAEDLTVYTDSYVSYKAIYLNTKNKISAIENLKELQGIYDYVLMRLPKNLAYFEDILCQLTQHLSSDSKIIAGSMVKHLPNGIFELLEKYIGKSSTSLAEKKARLVFAKFEKTVVNRPKSLEVKVDGFKNGFTNLSNLFSREKLDIGTRFFLEHIPKADFVRILDLGCGNGILGIKAKLLHPHAKIFFADVSAMALESAKINYSNFFDDSAEFFWTNCFEEGKEESMDLVLCNPPFHQDHTVGDFIALQMFQDSKYVLKKGGRIIVIGNSHLAYQISLKRIFGNSKILATNNKFMVIEVVKNG